MIKWRNNMENLSKVCTCKDLKCPFHPTNHNKGCSFYVLPRICKKEKFQVVSLIKLVMQVKWKAITMKILQNWF